MSNTILAPFILLLIPGVLLLLLGKSHQPTASQRKRLRSGGILCGIAFTYFGLATILGAKMSARPEVTGVIEDLRHNGRRNQSSTFKVDYGGVETTHLTCPYNGTALSEGETVFVRYLEFDHSILYLRVLSGPNAGWSLNVHANAWLWAFIVIVIAGASFYAAFAYGRATESPPKS